MKERPILFNAEMVRAILDGRKVVTRRIMKPQPVGVSGKEWPDEDRWGWPFSAGRTMVDMREVASCCPYGVPGDRLWVRETWRYGDWTEDGMPWIDYCADGHRALCEHVAEDWTERVSAAWAELSDPASTRIDGKASDRRWRPSIFMPRWASRITLEVTAVRVERLQEIAEDDARAEGVDRYAASCDHARFSCDEIDCLGQTYRASFAGLWDSINGDHASWASNPWVWVVEFSRCDNTNEVTQ